MMGIAPYGALATELILVHAMRTPAISLIGWLRRAKCRSLEASAATIVCATRA
jgi:hypothetical protein